MTLAGIDVSTWQTTTPSLSGLAFLFARATYGAVHDSRYAMHVANARKAGLLVGAYHFGVGDVPVADQVAAFLANAGDVDFYVLDLERNGSRVSMTQAQAAGFIRAVQSKHKTIGLYGSESGYPHLGQDYNWVAKWGTTPPSGAWTFWQYQGSPLDRDKFNGTNADLLRLAHRTPLSYHLSFLGGAFWVYTVSGGVITGRHAKRFGKPTGAPCAAPVRLPWAGVGTRLLVKVTTGALAGQYVGVTQSTVHLEAS